MKSDVNDSNNICNEYMQNEKKELQQRLTWDLNAIHESIMQM